MAVTPSQTRPDAAEIARICADVGYEKKGDEIVILDVGSILIITQYFVLVSGDTPKQLQAIADGMQMKLRPLGVRRYGREGYDEGKWVLVDYGDVIVHLFQRSLRSHYNLETIWEDAPRVPWRPPAGVVPAAVPAAPAVARPPAPDTEPEPEEPEWPRLAVRVEEEEDEQEEKPAPRKPRAPAPKPRAPAGAKSRAKKTAAAPRSTRARATPKPLPKKKPPAARAEEE